MRRRDRRGGELRRPVGRARPLRRDERRAAGARPRLLPGHRAVPARAPRAHAPPPGHPRRGRSAGRARPGGRRGARRRDHARRPRAGQGRGRLRAAGPARRRLATPAGHGPRRAAARRGHPAARSRRSPTRRSSVPSASPTTPDLPTPDEVERIAAVGDPVMRNLQITECYSRLAAVMRERGDPCSNWCTFATWASRQAGRTIRGEDLLAELQRELGRDAEVLHPVDALWRTLVRRGLFNRESRLGRLVAELHTPFDAFELASDAVARGNRKVFAEIGLRVRALPERVRRGRGARLRRRRRLPRRAAAGRPARGPALPAPGLHPLSAAALRARCRRRAELVVLANLEIGLHEQTRLQPEIGAALDAAATTGRPAQRQSRAPAARAPSSSAGSRASAAWPSRARSWC